MQSTRAANQTGRGPSDWFSGDVYIDTIGTPSDGSRLGAAVVHFAPGARTAWHTHLRGQTIWVSEGVGVCQRECGPVEVIRAGDSVSFEPGESHRDGAAPTRFMAHVAMRLADERGKPVECGRHVDDDEYARAPALDEGDR